MKKKISLFITGGVIYPFLEIICRGHSDFSMAVAGGVCLCMIDKFCNCRLKFRPLAVKCAAGSMIITTVEFITGILVNLVLKLNVWDYSQLPMNFMGQICVPFSLLWSIITIPAMQLCGLYDQLTAKVSERIKN
ncbi:hypothetical protein EQM14_04070 [Caproiciproducens sp. NJN-50]|uniref:putative ABC transporter permease n=1 Tax=Acutalibacteraceae TaxID=3082771 RepID=UPI000FFE21EC|nr:MULTISPECIES: hypothetical protein [Acutalibacteraceae]QAT49014.1 hypothetical protein EQM14_04070 [Caproiciproducens sp. NJN-50]